MLVVNERLQMLVVNYIGSKLEIKWIISTDRKVAGSSDWWAGSGDKYTSSLLFYLHFLPLGKMHPTCYEYSWPELRNFTYMADISV